MDRKLESEVKNLVKLGIPEEFAFIIACGKVGKPELANDVLTSFCEAQEDISREVAHFVPLEETLEKSSKLMLEETK